LRDACYLPKLVLKNLYLLLFALPLLLPVKIYPQDPKNFPKSLHSTRAGADHWYCEENGGFESITKMKISKDCLNCHSDVNAKGNTIIHSQYSPSCADCHYSEKSNDVSVEACINCHTHQTAEFGVTKDVHREKGMTCINCHTKSDLHGDGRELRSIYDGAIEKDCKSCHENIKQSVSHSVHSDKLDCSACHLESQVTCFNCHFESGKINAGLFGYVLLAQNSFTKKIQAANFMGLTFRDRTFLAISPYKAHSVKKEGRKCEDCHANSNVRQYYKNKKLQLTAWDEKKGKLTNLKGVIPVTTDWQKVITADFVFFDQANNKNGGWALLKRGIDKMQMLYLEPLSDNSVKMMSVKKVYSEENR